jgi:hypothetical protein
MLGKLCTPNPKSVSRLEATVYIGFCRGKLVLSIVISTKVRKSECKTAKTLKLTKLPDEPEMPPWRIKPYPL